MRYLHHCLTAAAADSAAGCGAAEDRCWLAVGWDVVGEIKTVTSISTIRMLLLDLQTIAGLALRVLRPALLGAHLLLSMCARLMPVGHEPD